MYFYYDFSQKIQIIGLYAWLIHQSNKIAIQLTNSIIRMKERGFRMKERGFGLKERGFREPERGFRLMVWRIGEPKRPWTQSELFKKNKNKKYLYVTFLFYDP